MVSGAVRSASGADGEPGAPGAPLLAMRGVQVALRSAPILRGVNLQLARGEVLLLAGRNGAGKTTLLRTAAGLLAPEAGELQLCGETLPSLPRREIARRVAYVPQQAAFAFPWSLLEVALMGRTPHLGRFGFETPRDLALARESLARLGIADLAGRSILEVSGGERQLAAIARALAQQAPLLLLDEPGAHLDLAHRHALHQLLRQLTAEGRSVLWVTHDLGPALSCADRVALLAEGRVLAAGAPSEVLRPDLLRAAFGVDARLIHSEAGPLLQLPR